MNKLHHSLRLLIQLRCGHPDGVNTLAGQPGIAGGIFGKPIGMDISIKLDTESYLGTVEIQDIRPCRILPAKLVAELLVTQ